VIGDGRDWQPVGAGVRRECPMCPWFAEEPPMESRTEATADGWTYRVRWHSAVPAGLVHIVTMHPGSDEAREIMARVDAHRAEATQ
jgi:hypothetical protein